LFGSSAKHLLFPDVCAFRVPWDTGASVTISYSRYLTVTQVATVSSISQLQHMGSQRLTLAEKQIHLRMRRLGYLVKQIVEATGNSSASVYRSFNKADNGHALVQAPSY
jgi:hypothetical protein